MMQFRHTPTTMDVIVLRVRMYFLSVAFLAVLLLPSAIAESPMQMHIVPIPVQSYRLLDMSMDDEGFIWVGSTSSVMLRYDPRSGKMEKLGLPFDMTVCSSLCVGKK